MCYELHGPRNNTIGGFQPISRDADNSDEMNKWVDENKWS